MNLVWVDLVKMEPKGSDEYFSAHHPHSGFTEEYAQSLYKRYLDKFQPWRVTVKSGDNQKPLFRSSERYYNRSDAVHAIELAFGCDANVYRREAEHGNEPLRLASWFREP